MDRLERRAERRYRFEQPLRYSIDGPDSAQAGVGRSVELGAAGLLFQADCPPPLGALLELQMTWPLRVQDACAVVLVIQGTVVRSDRRGTAVHMHDYQFQTAESRYDSAINTGAWCNLTG